MLVGLLSLKLLLHLFIDLELSHFLVFVQKSHFIFTSFVQVLLRKSRVFKHINCYNVLTYCN